MGLRGFFAAVGALGVKDIDLGLADFAARSKAIRLVLEGKGPSYFGSDEIEWVEILSDKISHPCGGAATHNTRVKLCEGWIDLLVSWRAAQAPPNVTPSSL
jgi:hypothetical protein